MEENNNNNFNEPIENITYKRVTNIPKQHSSGFGKSVVLPVFCGILGSALTLGVCTNVPSVREKVFGPTNSNLVVHSESDNQNLDLISLQGYSDTAISVADKILPSIVGIEVEYQVNSIFSRNPQTSTASGSGIIISEDGYILTNNHIVNTSSNSTYYQVSDASKVTVYLYNDTTPYEAKIVGKDAQTDLAVIKLDKTDLPAATLGNSDNVKVGEFAMAVGNPLGMQSSITCGVISALNREITDDEGTLFKLIQTDAAINSGNSGGALVNSKGEVIGINTMKLSGTGIEGMGFAIPISSTKSIYEQLIQEGKVKRPFIGITGIDLDEETAKANKLVQGIYVKSVEDFSAAQKADIRNGDVIIEANGKKVLTMDELNEIKNTHKVGDTMTLKINREGKEISIDVVLGETP